MHFYKLNGGLAQIPDVPHDISVTFLLAGARELSWADYLNFARTRDIKLKRNPPEIGEYTFHKRSKEEIEAHSNIESSKGYFDRLERMKIYRRYRYNTLHPIKPSVCCTHECTHKIENTKADSLSTV